MSKIIESPNLASQVICNLSRIHMDMKVKSIFRGLGEENEIGMIYRG